MITFRLDMSYATGTSLTLLYLPPAFMRARVAQTSPAAKVGVEVDPSNRSDSIQIQL